MQRHDLRQEFFKQPPAVASGQLHLVQCASRLVKCGGWPGVLTSWRMTSISTSGWSTSSALNEDTSSDQSPQRYLPKLRLGVSSLRQAALSISCEGASGLTRVLSVADSAPLGREG